MGDIKPEEQQDILGCIKSSIASREKEVILPFCYALMKPYLESCFQLWVAQNRKEVLE